MKHGDARLHVRGEAIFVDDLPSPRGALHAAVLGFAHPRTGERLCFEAPLPADLAALLAELEAAR